MRRRSTRRRRRSTAAHSQRRCGAASRRWPRSSRPRPTPAGDEPARAGSGSTCSGSGSTRMGGWPPLAPGQTPRAPGQTPHPAPHLPGETRRAWGLQARHAWGQARHARGQTPLVSRQTPFVPRSCRPRFPCVHERSVEFERVGTSPNTQGQATARAGPGLHGTMVGVTEPHRPELVALLVQLSEGLGDVERRGRTAAMPSLPPAVRTRSSPASASPCGCPTGICSRGLRAARQRAALRGRPARRPLGRAARGGARRRRGPARAGCPGRTS